MEAPKSPYLTGRQIADELGVSADTVRKMFERVPGVILVGAGTRKKMLRIPVEVYEAWKLRNAVPETLAQPRLTYRQARRANAKARAPRQSEQTSPVSSRCAPVIVYSRRERVAL